MSKGLRHEPPMGRKLKRKTVRLDVRSFDSALFAAMKAHAKAEDMLISEWLERAVIHELARIRKLHQALTLTAAPGDPS